MSLPISTSAIKVEYYKRDINGSYKMDKLISNIQFYEDGSYCYMVVKKSDGTSKRYVLKEI